MPIKDLLVHLDPSEASEARLAVAVNLAHQHQAHLTAVQVIDASAFVTVPAALLDGGDWRQVDELIRRMAERSTEAAAQVEAIFHRRVAAQGVTGEMHLVHGDLSDTLLRYGRCADLLVLGQPDPEAPDAMARRAIVETVLFALGRPILLVPYVGNFRTVGRNVLVGWDGGREATRALHDAMPLLQNAKVVRMVVANPSAQTSGLRSSGAEAARHLARHGLPASAEEILNPELGTADILLNRAADTGADLLVAGGYGHSRAREMILGGVTRSLLRQLTLPLLLSH
ncbi:universal stress protein [Roseomonas chloroacetimidivorans]|uniref:universal stress protein n=1 Tax=Roseomonas chloroacetimidivorans TaxID=1766656 RepID=UPI003C70B4F8